jgi:hypothetical protein
MAYNIYFSDPSASYHITVNDEAHYTGPGSGGLTLLGRNAREYGQTIAENSIHHLENFASPTSPTNPITGQLWYDSLNAKLKVRDVLTASWRPVNGVYQETQDPEFNIEEGNVRDGDIWVDTANQLLKVRFSGNWQIVGPTYSNSNRTGPYPTSLEDRTGTFHSVILMYLNDSVMEILAKEAFTPKTKIDGFDNLVPGMNLSSKTYDSVIPRLNGAASSALALKQTSPSTEIVSANNFVRNDLDQNINGVISIRNDAGLKIGATDSTFHLLRQSNGREATFRNLFKDGAFAFQGFTAENIPKQLMSLDISINQVTVGVPGVNPTNFYVAGTTTVTNKLNVLSTGSDSVTFNGGTRINKTLTVIGDTSISTSTINGQLIINSVDRNGTPITGCAIAVSSSTYDIGTTGTYFRNVYAKTFGISGVTQFNGTLNGLATGLASSTRFQVDGDVKTVAISDTVTFNGSQGSPLTFNVKLQPTAFTSKVLKATSTSTDKVIVYDNSTVTQMTKAVFLSEINYQDVSLGVAYGPGSLVPPGTIMPFGGQTLPSGWLWCDGASYNRFGTNALLYRVIGTTYGTQNTNDFCVPNLDGSLSSIEDIAKPGTVTAAIRYIIKT